MNRFLYLLIICFSFLCCTLNKNSTAHKECIAVSYADNVIPNVTDSISPFGQRIRKFGNDSIHAFNEDGSLSSIQYLDTASVIDMIRFRDGYKLWIRYNPLNSEDAIEIEDFFPGTNIVSSQTFMRDTIIVTAGNPIEVNRLIIEYHKNGKIKFTGYQGFFAAQGIPVGVNRHYNSLGQLYKTRNFIYPKSQDDNVFFPYIIETVFHNNGKPKWTKYFSNYVFFESGREGKLPFGTWRFYDENGRLIKTKKHENGELIETKRH